MPLAANWWTLTIRGVVAIFFGIFTFLWPAITLTALALLFGVYALIDGLFAIYSAIRGGHGRDRWWAFLIEGIVGLGAAAVTFLWPGLTIFALIFVVAAWAIVTGALEVAAAIRLRKQITGEWLLALAGVASLVFGFLLMFWPVSGAIVVAWWVGAYAFAFGILLVALSVRLRVWGRTYRPQVGLL